MPQANVPQRPKLASERPGDRRRGGAGREVAADGGKGVGREDEHGGAHVTSPRGMLGTFGR